jgi:IclR family transcriptional regulator, acetate operon repressor
VTVKRSSTSIQSVERASRILLAVAAEPSGLAAQDVSTRFGLTLSTAYHLLSTLADEGWLVKVEGRRYVLGPSAGELANSVARGLRPPAAYLAALQRLAEATAETTFLTGWQLGQIRIMATVEGAQAVRVAGLEVGLTGNIHARASGKLLLAFADDGTREHLLADYEFTRYTPNSIGSRAEFDTELEHIRAEGIGRDRQEFREGVYSVSAPIWRDAVVVAALAVSTPVQRFLDHEEAIISALRAEVASVSDRPLHAVS